jgi:hypothetical protein
MPVEIKEFSGNFTDVMYISELRGGFPDVPIYSDIDYAALIAGDDSPVFLTIPVGKAGVTSGNNRHYDEAWLQEFERQTVANKPVGLMGHLSDAQRLTEFPPEAIHWVGTRREGDLLWGKGYVPPGEARKRIQRYKAQGKKIATSIDAYCEGVWDDKLSAYRMNAASLKLAQIDIAPADRAGIPALASLPNLSTEMSDNQPGQQPQETYDMTDKLTVIREMTPDDARLLPKPVRDAVIGTIQPAPEVATVAAIRETLGLDASADPVAAITEMRRVQAEQAKATVTGKITELVAAGIKAEAMRPLVTELVTARNPQTVADAEAAYNTVANSDSVKAMLAAHVVNTLGPRQATPVQPQQGANKYFQIPAQAEA